MDVFGRPRASSTTNKSASADVPRYIAEIKETLEAVLHKADLSIWLMIDRLDEIFLRRSRLEARALRGLLRCTRQFSTPTIRVKVFLRDDMLEEILSSGKGFTALTHITARQADTLRWPEDQILTMLVKRLFANPVLSTRLAIDHERLNASHEYRSESFYKVFPVPVTFSILYQERFRSSRMSFCKLQMARVVGSLVPELFNTGWTNFRNVSGKRI